MHEVILRIVTFSCRVNPIRPAILIIGCGLLACFFREMPDAIQAKPQGTISSATVLGHVYNAETQMPIAGATVVLLDLQNHKDLQIQTSTDGSYSIRNISRGSYFLAAYAGHFLNQYFGEKLEDRDTYRKQI